VGGESVHTGTSFPHFEPWLPVVGDGLVVVVLGGMSEGGGLCLIHTGS